ncbi:tripartite tricarboxylate transporter substrate binding protein [Ramlibacter sp. PS3R-8]|uniref:tripartite tricarboxylate transporter substrate binding protein n=1 Tax=Ramlibacter sp. PS3R-8 TaxID=3133437 RepID=UPI0030AF4765
MHMNRRQALGGLAGLAAPGLLLAQATSFPTKAVEIQVGATAGGATDIGARLAGQMLSEAWGQPVVIQNKAGAGGSIAAAAVARAEKTGHVVGLATDSTVIINPLVVADTGYRLEDFQLLTPLYTGAFAVAVHKDFPANTLKEFIAEVRRKREITCAMFGTVSSPRLVAEMFADDAGVKLVPVAYKGEIDGVRDIVAGIVPAFFGTTASLIPQHKAGTLKILGVSFTERLQALPDVPTFREAGLENTVYRWFHGLMLPAGTPRAVVDKYSAQLQKVVTSDRFRAGIASDLTPTFMQPAAFTEMALATRERVQVIIRGKNLKP